MRQINDPDVHFRYHDAVNALIGNHCYRYERMRFSDAHDHILYLQDKGFDEFSIREFKPWAPWGSVIACTNYRVGLMQRTGSVHTCSTCGMNTGAYA